jgi:antitoxin (DNA-binding transcriptional repressor) of toxin-antitoxin stability system
MLTVNTHEAKTKLSALLMAVEQKGETVIVCRDGRPIAELHAVSPRRKHALPPVSKKLMPVLNYDPTETAAEDEWPEELR